MPPIDPFHEGQPALQDAPPGLSAPTTQVPGPTPYALRPKYALPPSPERTLLTVAAVLVALLLLFWGAGEQHYQSCVARSAVVDGDPSGCSILPWSKPGD